MSLAVQLRSIIAFAARLFSLGIMTVKRGLGIAFQLGLEKLVIMPILLREMGERELGQLILALSYTRMLVSVPSMGIADGILKLNTVAKAKQQWPALFRAGLVLTVAVSGLICLGALGIVPLAGLCDTHMLLVFGIPLGAATLLDAVKTVLVSAPRLELRFGAISALEAGTGCLLILALPMALAWGSLGASMGYLLAYAGGMFLALRLARPSLQAPGMAVRAWVKPLTTVSSVLAVTGGLGLFTRQAGRLALGFTDASDVTVFFAAEAALGIFVIPITFFSGVVYTLVCRKNRDEIRKRVIVEHVIGCFLAVVLFYFAARLFGPWLIWKLYKPVAAEAIPVFSVMLLGSALLILHEGARGFLYKFCRLRTILTLAVINSVVVGGLVFVLTHMYGLTGAAWGVSLGSAFISLLWFGVYVYLFLIKQPPRPPVDKDKDEDSGQVVPSYVEQQLESDAAP